MARGGYGRGAGIALQDRRRVGGEAPAGPASPPPHPAPPRPPAPAGPAPRVRHCWVQHVGAEWPGVVVQWRRDETGWSALVSWVEDTQSLRVEWVPASRLRRA